MRGTIQAQPDFLTTINLNARVPATIRCALSSDMWTLS